MSALNILSGILLVIGSLPYLWAIIHHSTNPSPVSWAVWGVVDTIALVAMRNGAKDSGAKIATGQILAATVVAWTITVLSLRFGTYTIGPVDWVTVAIAAIGILLWKTTGHGVLALVCSQIATLAGGVPTMIDGWHNPAQENAVAWCIWWASCIVALFAVRNWRRLDDVLQPLVFTTIETVMVAFVVIRPYLF